MSVTAAWEKVSHWKSKGDTFKGWFKWTAKKKIEKLIYNTLSQMSKTTALKNLKCVTCIFWGLFPL